MSTYFCQAYQFFRTEIIDFYSNDKHPVPSGHPSVEGNLVVPDIADKYASRKLEKALEGIARQVDNVDAFVRAEMVDIAEKGLIVDYEKFLGKQTPDKRASAKLGVDEMWEMAEKRGYFNNIDENLGKDGYGILLDTQGLFLRYQGLAMEAVRLRNDLENKPTTAQERSDMEALAVNAEVQANEYFQRYQYMVSNSARILRMAQELRGVKDPELAGKIIEKLNREKVAVREMLEQLKGIPVDTLKPSARQTKHILAKLIDPSYVEEVKNRKDSKRGNSFYEWMLKIHYSNILSSPNTHSKNVFDTMGNVLVEQPLLNSVIEIADMIRDGGGELSFMRGMGKGAKSGLSSFKKTMKGEPTGLKGDKFGSGRGKLTTPNSSAFARGADWTYSRVGTLLEAVDSFNFDISYYNFIPYLAGRLARNQEYRDKYYPGVSAKDLRERLIAEPTPAMKAQAEKYALEQTYNQVNPDGFLGAAAKFIEDYRRQWESSGNAAKIGVSYLTRVVLPFTRIVANRGNSALDYVVGANWIRTAGRVKTMREALAADDVKYQKLIDKAVNVGNVELATAYEMSQLTNEIFTHDEIRRQQARMWAGTVLSGVLLMLLKGAISGSGSPDREKREQMEGTGWRPYSIKLGDKWYSYQNMPRLNMLLSMIGNWHDAMEYRKFNESDGWVDYSRFLYASLGVNRMFLDQSFLSGLADVLTILEDGDVNRAKRFLASGSTTLVSPNGFKYIHDLFDDRSKSPRTQLQHYANEMRWVYDWGSSDYVPVRVNAFGDRLTKNVASGHGVMGAVGKIMGMDRGYEQISDPEMLSLTKRVHRVGMWMPASNGNVVVRFGKEERRLDHNEREKFLRYRGVEYTRLLKQNKRVLDRLLREIESGNEGSRDKLEQVLRRLHGEANDYGKRRMVKGK